MEFWKQSLVQWVNISGLLPQEIKHIRDLSDGRFFHRLLRMLQNRMANDTELKEEPAADEIFRTVMNFLRCEYPDFDIDCDVCQVRDEREITNITSLLLLHCCLRSNIHYIIARMCEKLTHDAQIKVKRFLECLMSSRNVTRERLQEAIRGKADAVGTHGYAKYFTSSPKLSCAIYSPRINRPLKDFLQSPAARQQKLLDRQSYELRRLKAEIEQQKFEKIDFQEEVQILQEKLRTLSCKYNEKVEEIKKLHEKALIAEDGASELQDANKEETNNNIALKKEIANLELYITSLESDISSLQDERQSLIHKLNITERHSKIWQEKAEYLEPVCCHLEKKVEEKEQELSVVHEHCQELTSYIQGMKPDSDVSIEWDYSDMPPNLSPVKDLGENLGSTIIDLQLKERIEENKLLQEQVAYLQVEKEEMNESICKLQADLQKANIDNENILKSNLELAEKVKQLMIVEVELKAAKNQVDVTKSQLNCLVNQQTSLKKVVEDLGNDIIIKDDEIFELRAQTSALKCDIEEWRKKYNETQDCLQNKVQHCEQIVGELADYKQELEGMTQQADAAEKKAFKAVHCIDRTNLILQNCKLQLLGILGSHDDDEKKEIFGDESTFANFEMNVETLNNLLIELIYNYGESLEKQKNLEAFCEKANKNVELLQGEVCAMEEKVKIYINEKKQLEEYAKYVIRACSDMKCTLDDYNQKICDLTAKVEERKKLAQELEEAQKVMAANNLTIEQLQEAHDHSRSKLFAIKNDLLIVTKERDCCKTLYNDLISNDEQIIADLKQELQICKKEVEKLHEGENVLKEELCKLQDRLNSTTIELDEMEKMCTCAKKECEEQNNLFSREKLLLQNEIKKLDAEKQEFGKALERAADEVKLLSEAKEVLFTFYKNLVEKCNLLHDQLVSGTNDISGLIEDPLNVRSQNDSQESLPNSCNVICIIDAVKKKNNDIHKFLEEKVNVLQEEMEKQEQEKILIINDLEVKKINLMKENDSKQVTLLKLNETIQEREYFISKLENQISSLQADVNVLKEQEVILEKQLACNILELTEVKSQHILVTEALENRIKEKYQNICDINVKLQASESEKQLLKLNLEAATLKICQLSFDKEVLTTYETQNQENVAIVNALTNEVTMLQSGIEDLEKDKLNVNNILQLRESELKEVKVHNESLLQKNKELEKANMTLEKSMELQYNKLKGDRDSIECQLHTMKCDLSEIMDQHSALNADNNMKCRQIEILSDECLNLRTDLEFAKQQYSTSLKDFQNTVSVLEKEKCNKDNMLQMLTAAQSTKDQEIMELTHLLKKEIKELEKERNVLKNSLQTIGSELSVLKISEKELMELHLKEIKEKEETIEALTNDIKELSGKIETLEKEGNEKHEALQMTRARLEDVQNDMEAGKRELLELHLKEIKEKEETIEALTNDVKELSGKIETLEKEGNEKHEALQKTRARLEDVQNDMEAGKRDLLVLHLKEVKEKEETIEALTNDIKELSGKIETLEKEGNEKHEALQMTRARLEDVQNDMEAGKRELLELHLKEIKEKEETIEALTNDVKELSGKIETLEKEGNEKHEALQMNRARLEDVQNDMEAGKRELLELHLKEIKEKEGTIEALTNDVKELSGKIETLEKEGNEKHEALQMTRARLEDVQNDMEAGKRELLELHLKEIKEKEETIEALTDDIKELSGKIETLEKEGNEKHEALQMTRARLEDVQNDMEAGKRELLELHLKEIKEKEGTIEALTNDVKELSGKIETLEKEGNEKHEALQIIRARLEDVQNDMEAGKRELLELNLKEIKEKEETIEALTNDVKELSGKIEILEKEGNEKHEALQIIRARLEDVQNDMEAGKRELLELHLKEIKEKEETIEALTNDVKELSGKIETLEKEGNEKHEALQIIRARLEDVQNDMEAGKRELLELHLKEIKEKEETIEALTDDVKELSGKIETLEKEGNEKHEALQIIRAKLNEKTLAKNHHHMVAEHSKIRAPLEERIHELENERKSVVEQLEDMKVQLIAARNSGVVVSTICMKLNDENEFATKRTSFGQGLDGVWNEKNLSETIIKAENLQMSNLPSETVLNNAACKCVCVKTDTDCKTVTCVKANERSYSDAHCVLKEENVRIQSLLKEMQEMANEQNCILMMCKSLACSIRSLKVKIEGLSDILSEKEKKGEGSKVVPQNGKFHMHSYPLNVDETTVTSKLTEFVKLPDCGDFSEFLCKGTCQTGLNHATVDECNPGLKGNNIVKMLDMINKELLSVTTDISKMFKLMDESFKDKLLHAVTEISKMDDKYMVLLEQYESIASENKELRSSIEELGKSKMFPICSAVEEQNNLLQKCNLQLENTSVTNLRESCKAVVMEMDSLKDCNKQLLEKQGQWEMMQLKWEEEYLKFIHAKKESDVKVEQVIVDWKDLQRKLLNLHCIAQDAFVTYGHFFKELSSATEVGALKSEIDRSLVELETEFVRISGDLLSVMSSNLDSAKKTISRWIYMMNGKECSVAILEDEMDVSMSVNGDQSCKPVTEIPTVQSKIHSSLNEVAFLSAKCKKLEVLCEAAVVTCRLPSRSTTHPWTKEIVSGMNSKERAELLQILMSLDSSSDVQKEDSVIGADSILDDSLEGSACQKENEKNPTSNEFPIRNLHEMEHLKKQVIEHENKIKSLNKLLMSSEKNQSDLQKKLSEMRAFTKGMCNEKEKAMMMKGMLEERVKDLQAEVARQENSAKSASSAVSQIKETYKVLIDEKCTLQTKYSDLKLKFIEKQKEWQREREELKCASLQPQIYKADLEKQIDNVRSQYEDKLERLKSQMVRKFQGDINELRSQMWDLSEKLLKEQEEKSSLSQQMTELKKRYMLLKSNDMAYSMESLKERRKRADQCRSLADEAENSKSRKHMDIVDESITVVRTRKRSVRMSIPSGQAFPPEDEEGEVFNATYLADMKAGQCHVQTNKERVSVLQYRNSLCPPHLKSSYPAETQCHDPRDFSDEDLKMGCAVVDFDQYDTLSTSCLIPGEKHKKKDRGQTSYKKPGPPTPGKNGGRHSLQGSELGITPRSILREHNDSSASRKGVTPSRLKSLFTSKSVTSRRDENSPVTPRSRGLSFFRKPLKNRSHPL